MLSLDEIKRWLGSGVDLTSEHDDMLTELEKNMVAYFEQATGRYFGVAQEFVEVLSGNGYRKMWVASPPLDDTVTSVEVRTGIGETWTTLTSTEYEVRGRRLYRAGGYVWIEGVDNYRVTYDSGYSSAEVPEDVKQAVLELIQAAWQNRVTGTPVFIGEGGFTELNRPQTVTATINRWKRPHFGASTNVGTSATI